MPKDNDYFMKNNEDVKFFIKMTIICRIPNTSQVRYIYGL